MPDANIPDCRQGARSRVLWAPVRARRGAVRPAPLFLNLVLLRLHTHCLTLWPALTLVLLRLHTHYLALAPLLAWALLRLHTSILFGIDQIVNTFYESALNNHVLLKDSQK